MKSILLWFVCTCTTLHASFNPQTTAKIDEVYIVFMNHLDVGFDGINPIIGFAANVVNKYFDIYFPLALEVAATMRANSSDRFIYTTHPWLVSMYLDCPSEWVWNNSAFPLGEIPQTLHCPNSSAKAAFIAGIQRGDISWHAYPFNGSLAD